MDEETGMHLAAGISMKVWSVGSNEGNSRTNGGRGVTRVGKTFASESLLPFPGFEAEKGQGGGQCLGLV